jgi:hypothetical protein
MPSLLRLLVRMIAVATTIVVASYPLERPEYVREDGSAASFGDRAQALVVQAIKVRVLRAQAPSPRGPSGPAPVSGSAIVARRVFVEPECAPLAARRQIEPRALRRIPRMGSEEPPRAHPLDLVCA